jgi:glycosyltransferase involved in cell wall biosynthesis
VTVQKMLLGMGTRAAALERLIAAPSPPTPALRAQASLLPMDSRQTAPLFGRAAPPGGGDTCPATPARVSVIIPTRNEARSIAAFLESLPPDVDLIVVDASDDPTPAIIAARRPERTLVIRAPVGIAAARQLGAQAARGDWLLFSDADVRFTPGYFARLAPYLAFDAFYGVKRATAAHPWYDCCFGAGQRVCHRLGIPAASGSNMAVRREAFAAVGGFRADLPVNEDSELMLRLARHGYRVAFAPDLAVDSLDDRRLDRGALRKLLHSASRTALLAAGLYVPVPQRWLRHDWGYWRRAERKAAEPCDGAGRC